MAIFSHIPTCFARDSGTNFLVHIGHGSNSNCILVEGITSNFSINCSNSTGSGVRGRRLRGSGVGELNSVRKQVKIERKHLNQVTLTFEFPSCELGNCNVEFYWLPGECLTWTNISWKYKDTHLLTLVLYVSRRSISLTIQNFWAVFWHARNNSQCIILWLYIHIFVIVLNSWLNHKVQF